MAATLKNVFPKYADTISARETAQRLFDYYYSSGKPIEDIPLADLVKLTYSGDFSPQRRTSVLELNLAKQCGWKKVAAKDNIGDYIDTDGKYLELKSSSTNEQGTINLLQIRPWQKVDYYLVIYFDLINPEKSYSYKLSKEEMGTVSKVTIEDYFDTDDLDTLLSNDIFLALVEKHNDNIRSRRNNFYKGNNWRIRFCNDYTTSFLEEISYEDTYKLSNFIHNTMIFVETGEISRGSITHGTWLANSSNNQLEYSIHLKLNNNEWTGSSYDTSDKDSTGIGTDFSIRTLINANN